MAKTRRVHGKLTGNVRAGYSGVIKRQQSYKGLKKRVAGKLEGDVYGGYVGQIKSEKKGQLQRTHPTHSEVASKAERDKHGRFK